MINQVELCSVILLWLDKQGVEGLFPRQINVIAKAATEIVEAMKEPEREVVPGMGLTKWLQSDHTGRSSVFVAWTLCGDRRGGYGYWPRHAGEYAYPHDPSDLGRCLGLLDAVPEFRERILEVAATGPEWSRLINVWPELERIYREEFPSGTAPRCYAAMRAAIKGATP